MRNFKRDEGSILCVLKHSILKTCSIFINLEFTASVHQLLPIDDVKRGDSETAWLSYCFKMVSILIAGMERHMCRNAFKFPLYIKPSSEKTQLVMPAVRG